MRHACRLHFQLGQKICINEQWSGSKVVDHLGERLVYFTRDCLEGVNILGRDEPVMEEEEKEQVMEER